MTRALPGVSTSAAWLGACLGVVLLAPGSAANGFDSPVAAGQSTAQRPAVPHLREPWAGLPGLLTAGQPGATAWPVLADDGVVAVINLRPDAELAGRDERAEVVAAGMAYHALPVAGANDLTADNAARLWRLVHAQDGRVLVHCASGNRVGALLAIGAAQLGGMAPEQALAFGQAAGLTSPALEAAVRERLGLPRP